MCVCMKFDLGASSARNQASPGFRTFVLHQEQLGRIACFTIRFGCESNNKNTSVYEYEYSNRNSYLYIRPKRIVPNSYIRPSLLGIKTDQLTAAFNGCKQINKHGPNSQTFLRKLS